MSTEQIKKKYEILHFFLIQTFLDAYTDFDFRMKSKYKVQGFRKKSDQKPCTLPIQK